MKGFGGWVLVAAAILFWIGLCLQEPERSREEQEEMVRLLTAPETQESSPTTDQTPRLNGPSAQRTITGKTIGVIGVTVSLPLGWHALEREPEYRGDLAEMILATNQEDLKHVTERRLESITGPIAVIRLTDFGQLEGEPTEQDMFMCLERSFPGQGNPGKGNTQRRTFGGQPALSRDRTCFWAPAGVGETWVTLKRVGEFYYKADVWAPDTPKLESGRAALESILENIKFK